MLAKTLGTSQGQTEIRGGGCAFSTKRQTASILGFADEVSIKTTQLCCGHKEAALGKEYICFFKTLFTKSGGEPDWVPPLFFADP